MQQYSAPPAPQQQQPPPPQERQAPEPPAPAPQPKPQQNSFDAREYDEGNIEIPTFLRKRR
jgi:hypothetical protein